MTNDETQARRRALTPATSSSIMKTITIAFAALLLVASQTAAADSMCPPANERAFFLGFAFLKLPAARSAGGCEFEAIAVANGGVIRVCQPVVHSARF